MGGPYDGRSWALLVAVLPLVALLAAAPSADARHLDDGTWRCDGGWCADGRDHLLDCRDGNGCVGRTGGFTTIIRPGMGDGGWLDDRDWVLGIEVDGEARAYPIRIISGQQGWEMVIDQVGGTEVMATYCPLCASGIAYETAVDGERRTFRNTGAIWRQDMVMYDVQTGSLWSQVAGEALHGPLQGTTLDLVTGEMVRWSAWKQAHPDTLAMERPVDAGGDPLCSCPPFTRLEPGSLVHGVVLDGQALAFPLSVVRDEGVAQLTFAGRDVVVAYAGDNVHVFDAAGRSFARSDDGASIVATDDGTRYDALTGRAEDGSGDLENIPGRTTFGHRWELFFPDSWFYQGGSQVGTHNPAGDALPGVGVGSLLLALIGAAAVVVVVGRLGRRR